MKKILISVITMVLISQGICSQNSDENIDIVKSTVRLHLLDLGILLEQEIQNNLTIVFDLAAGLSYKSSVVNEVRESALYLNPYLKIEPRIYTNQKRRQHLGKRTDYYSGQYFGFQVRLSIPTNQLNKWQSYGPIWGFQRTLGKKGYWNIGLGLSLTHSGGEIMFGTIGDFGIGFILN